jgi:hypothetical protein
MMSAIFISDQEAKEICDVLEYAYDCAQCEAQSEIVLTAKVQPPEYMEANRRETQCARLLTDIKRRVRK